MPAGDRSGELFERDALEVDAAMQEARQPIAAIRTHVEAAQRAVEMPRMHVQKTCTRPTAKVFVATSHREVRVERTDVEGNDAEGVMLAIRRDGSTFGQLQAAVTVAHTDFFSFVPAGDFSFITAEDEFTILELEAEVQRDANGNFGIWTLRDETPSA